MKKVFCLFLSAMLLAVPCVSPALAANSARGQSVDTPYEYPVLPGTPAWNELDSLEEKIAVCRVDEELLASMTTAALLETVLNYPLLVNIYAFSSVEMGIESVSQYFPGLPLLLAREDAMECLSSYLETAPLSENDTEAVVRQTSASVLARYMRESNTPPSANDKACWSGSPHPVHSAIVRSVSGRTAAYISKWGFNGVFIHSANDGPYTGSVTYWGK